jgi:hypothetical protein
MMRDGSQLALAIPHVLTLAVLKKRCYDSFVNFDDEELFFVLGIDYDHRWVKAESLPI